MFKTYKKSIEEIGNLTVVWEGIPEPLPFDKDEINVLKTHLKTHTLEMLRVDIERLKGKMEDIEKHPLQCAYKASAELADKMLAKALQEEIDLKEEHYKLIDND